MYSFKSYDACKAYQEEQHKLMEARAKEKGLTLAHGQAGRAWLRQHEGARFSEVSARPIEVGPQTA